MYEFEFCLKGKIKAYMLHTSCDMFTVVMFMIPDILFDSKKTQILFVSKGLGF